MSAARDFEFRMPIRWGDLDSMGHVNNTVYFRFFEQARIAWFESLRMGTGPHGEGPILARVSCDFMRPLTYPGDVIVRQLLRQLGRSSVTLDLELRRSDGDALYAKGDSVIVWMDYDKGRSTPWPVPMREILSG
jgi:acyl-CoA thioester hydrolase